MKLGKGDCRHGFRKEVGSCGSSKRELEMAASHVMCPVREIRGERGTGEVREVCVLACGAGGVYIYT
jgi:hypothetical protein